MCGYIIVVVKYDVKVMMINSPQLKNLLVML